MRGVDHRVFTKDRIPAAASTPRIRAVDGGHRHLTPFATIPSITKLYLTPTEYELGQSLGTWSIFAYASLLWAMYGLLAKKTRINVGNAVSLVMNVLMVNGTPDA